MARGVTLGIQIQIGGFVRSPSLHLLTEAAARGARTRSVSLGFENCLQTSQGLEHEILAQFLGFPVFLHNLDFCPLLYNVPRAMLKEGSTWAKLPRAKLDYAEIFRNDVNLLICVFS